MHIPGEFYHIMATIEWSRDNVTEHTPELSGYLTTEAELRRELAEILLDDKAKDITVLRISSEAPYRDVTRDALEDFIHDAIIEGETDPDTIADITLADGFSTRDFAREMDAADEWGNVA